MEHKDLKKREIILRKYLLSYGYFSEYLPDEFSISKIKDTFKKNNIGNVKPYCYSMSRFHGDNQRRVIQIPELISYLAAIEQLDADILSKIVQIDDESSSFSKLILNDKIVRYSNPSDGASSVIIKNNVSDNENSFDFSSNLMKKIVSSKGSKGILYLDIANFFGNFYTHNITALFYGAEWAQEQYNISKETGKTVDEYNKLNKLDKAIENLNIGRTHGLLTGPFVSKMLAETLMCRIDKELENVGINFSRFMDDYEINIYDENDIPSNIAKVEDLLYKYGFSLNSEKTKYISFPYCNKKDLTPIFNSDKENIKIINGFNHFVEMELEKDQKGAIKYFMSRISEFDEKETDLILALVVNAIINNPNSTIIAIKELIKILDANKEKINNIIECLLSFLRICIKNNYELEQVWIVYAILKVNPKHKFNYCDIENLTELAFVVILGEQKNLKKIMVKKIIKKCFLLDYELWQKDLISDNELFQTYALDQTAYLELKKRRFTFYTKQ